MAELYERIENLCKEKGISITQMCKDSGASRGSLGDLANNRIQSLSANTLQKIAIYFNVSTDYLTGKTKYKNNQEVQDVAWGITRDPFFEAPFDFCSLLKDIREQQNITAEEMSKVLGCTKEQYEECEEGILPINFEQAEKLCEYLGTDVSQVLFDNQLYDDDVPEEYHDDVRAWEIMKSKAEKEVMNETLGVTENTSDIDIRRIQRAKSTMTENEWSRFMEVAKAAFPKYFSEDFVDDDTDE